VHGDGTEEEDPSEIEGHRCGTLGFFFFLTGAFFASFFDWGFFRSINVSGGEAAFLALRRTLAGGSGSGR